MDLYFFVLDFLLCRVSGCLFLVFCLAFNIYYFDGIVVRRVEMATCTRDRVPHYMTHETILTMPLPHLWIQTSRFHCSNVTEIGTLPYTDTTMYACICTVSLLIRWSSARHAVHSVAICVCMRWYSRTTLRVCVRMACMYASIRHKHSTAKNGVLRVWGTQTTNTRVLSSYVLCAIGYMVDVVLASVFVFKRNWMCVRTTLSLFAISFLFISSFPILSAMSASMCACLRACGCVPCMLLDGSKLCELKLTKEQNEFNEHECSIYVYTHSIRAH